MKKKPEIIALVALLVLGAAGTGMGEICLDTSGGETFIFALKNLGKGIYAINGYYLDDPVMGMNSSGTIIAAGGMAYFGLHAPYPYGTGNRLFVFNSVINLSTDTGTYGYQAYYYDSGTVFGGYISGLNATLIRGCTADDKGTPPESGPLAR